MVQRQGLKDIIANMQAENLDICANLKTLQEASLTLTATSKTDELNLRDKLAAARAELADQDARHRLEVKEIKTRFASKLQVENYL